MVQLFANFGALIRMLIGLGFAGFWGFCAWYWYGMGEDGPGMPTVVGVAFLAGLAGLGALFNLIRLVSGTAKAAAAPARSAPSTDAEAASDFDADAVMARYLSQRQGGSTAMPRAIDETPSAAAPVRPQFGRKAV